MNLKLTLSLLAGSLALTAVCFLLGLPFFFLFLCLPLLGLLPKRETRICPHCGVPVHDTDIYCPACGTKLA